MNINDLLDILGWWSILFSMGLIFLPTSALIFNKFFDKGYIFSKILGLACLGYLVWMLASIKLLSFTNLHILIILALLAFINLGLIVKKKLFRDLKDYLKIFFLEELIFTVGLIFWAYIKSFEPSVHGLEKYMDFGFINSILRSEYFPPKDLWLTPLDINYYYFGHFITALLTKISAIDPVVTFNLMLSTIFAFCLTASFSIGANLYHYYLGSKHKLNAIRYTLIPGFLSAFLVTLSGNLQTIYAFFQNYIPPEQPVPFWQLPLKWNLEGYWYPNATRFIPFTIHEFPGYSFVVSDLHGHVLNIPFILLAIAIFVKIWFQKKFSKLDYLLLGLLIAIFLMTNVLDAPIYLLGVLIITILYKKLSTNINLESIITILKPLTIIAALSIILSLPYWLSFKPFGSGIGVLCAPQILTDQGKIGPLLFETDHCTRSTLWMLLVLWGFPLATISSFIIFLKKSRKTEDADHLVLVLSLFAVILFIIPEFFYVKDIYPAHYRANTVFKFGYQAFIIFGLTCGYMLARIITGCRNKKTLILNSLFLIPLFLLVAIYPLFAINSYFGGLKNMKSLSGLDYLRDLYPSDYIGILWLRDNTTGQPVILEAQGDSYTDYARVSANTGLPTVIGWPVHEWLWRGSYDEAGKRIPEVNTLFESPDVDLTRELIKKYNISYVFVGSLERQKYKLNEAKFLNLGKIIFQNGQTTIYKIN